MILVHVVFVVDTWTSWEKLVQFEKKRKIEKNQFEVYGLFLDPGKKNNFFELIINYQLMINIQYFY